MRFPQDFLYCFIGDLLFINSAVIKQSIGEKLHIELLQNCFILMDSSDTVENCLIQYY